MSQKKNKKKLKKELFLNYTVMLLPHSQDKPIHFRIPVWIFLTAFLCLFTMFSMTLYFSYSSYRLRNVTVQKSILETELDELEAEKARLEKEKKRLSDSNVKVAQENAALVRDQDAQERELEELRVLSDQVLKELEELHQRENDIRDELGLETAESQDGEEGSPQGDGDSAQQHSGFHITSVQNVSSGMPAVTAQGLEENFNLLRKGIKRQEESYDSMKAEIAVKLAEKQKVQLRDSIVNYALQFLGNSYVYGGRDPHSGVDCSGFTRYVLGHVAGVYLNGTASSQSQQGVSVSISQARPGDLVFYGSGSGVNHVAIYIGNGQVVHASNERNGIIVSTWNYRTPVAIKNVID